MKNISYMFGIPCAQERGFSLVEMVVSVALFAIIMLVAMGALLALVDASRKSRTLESVMNNLNISLDGMVRGMRMGSYYHCGSTLIPAAPDWGDCTAGVEPQTSVPAVISFAPYGSDPTTQTERTVYFLGDDSEGRQRIYRSLDGGANSIPITAPEVEIDEMQMYVIGSEPGDVTQPKIVLVVKGTAGGNNVKLQTSFYIQATAVQRSLDI